ncbi:MAG: amidohydrolase family protein [Acidimicrobiales bacterium]|nr:amidohydrolase family protein [Acidimicrobiales bacterium]
MGRIFFTGANLLDGARAAVAGTTVVVDGQHISFVGPDTDAPGVDAADTVVTLDGATLMPGMVSGHFHTTYHDVGAVPAPFGLEHPPAFQAYRALVNVQTALSWGYTAVVGASAAFDVDASLRAAIEQGLVEGPRLVPASRDLITRGDSNDTLPWWYEASAQGVVRVCDGPEEFRRATRDEIARGAHIVKVYVTGGHGVTLPKNTVSLEPDELAAVMRAAHGRGRRVRAHVATRDAILMCVDLGVDVIDHADGMDDACIAAMVDAGSVVVPSLLLPLTMLELMGNADTYGFLSETAADVAQMCEILPAADAAGVCIAVGDDYGASVLPHGAYSKELAAYVEHVGVDPLTVLRWATVNGAALFGRPDDLGRVEVGRLADLVVVDGDPSADISVLTERRNLRHVVKDGRFVSDSGVPTPTSATGAGRAT